MAAGDLQLCFLIVLRVREAEQGCQYQRFPTKSSGFYVYRRDGNLNCGEETKLAAIVKLQRHRYFTALVSKCFLSF
jgi:hypothetical protein